ncbi:type-F conjugative transfer system pilin acetylase TraX, partial [Escherichia coli]|nr:type-F conjugative transfer system pilin acetylase TraX [Escherichia coli]MCK2984673.1 type-F conjugative transfer system pilin acetylase TraX [Escherichia coli]MCK3003048.1 type-F conjugative transfer system pilin acetylase TraX [Escherichia coli]MCK3036123.1 type-F conjugative transfer system pilin acetylase TraX [Escherichia coli]
DDGLITLQDAEGNTRLISPREAVAEGVTLYTPDTIRVGTGDRMRFTKSDRERGYVANSVWTVTAVSGDSVTLSDGQQTRVIRPGQERAEQHIDLAYAITAHGAQGASETFAIALEGTEGNRKLMAGFESAYVALSRMKQHVQVYTDNRQGWTDAINNAVQKGTAHDVFEPKPDREVMNAERLFSTARELRDVAAGRAVLRQAGLAGGDSPARFIAPGRKYPQPAINRLWGWGVIAQFAYYLAGFPWYEGNILFAFAVAAQVLTWCETRSLWRTAAAILLMALWGPLSGTSYGIAGLLMLAVSHRLYRAEDRTERLVLVACLLTVIPALNLATSDTAAVAGLVMTVLTVGLVSCAGKSLPRFWPGDFFPTFYACHLAVLGVLAL